MKRSEKRYEIELEGEERERERERDERRRGEKKKRGEEERERGPLFRSSELIPFVGSASAQAPASTPALS